MRSTRLMNSRECNSLNTSRKTEDSKCVITYFPCCFLYVVFDQPGDGSFDPHYDAGRARDALQRIVDDEVAPSQPEAVLQAVNDLPARALLDAGRGAWLLVVGSRGLGGFQGLLLGSVSQQVVHHAECPVLVVPEPCRG